MKNTTILAGIVLVLIVVGAFVMYGSGKSSSLNGNVVNGQGDVQKITLGIKNGNYYPNTITVKEGQPVSITLDSSVGGCLRSFTIKDLGVQGYSQNPSETIDFTPNKKGTFRFACSMGMGYGTIIVE